MESEHSTNKVDRSTEPRRRKSKHTLKTEEKDNAQEFFFVDGSTTNKGKRSHVMRHHIRSKKKERRKQSVPIDQETQLKEGKTVRILPWDIKPEQELPARDQIRPIAAIVSATITLQRSNQPESVLANTPYKPQISWQSPTGSLRGRLLTGESKFDPFESLPIVLTDEAQKLADFWTSKLAYWSGQNTYMKIVVFKEAILNLMTFHSVILTYGARYEAHMAGHDDAGQAEAYVAAAERYLEQEITKSESPSDEKIVMALSSLALQEDRYGSKEKSARFMDDAMERMRSRVGECPLHETIMHYARFTRSLPEPDVEIDPSDIAQLVGFIREAETTKANIAYLTQEPMYITAFQFRSPLHLLLAAGPHPSHVPHDERKWVVKYGSLHEQCRIAALIYITAAMLDNRDSPIQCARFVNSMLMKVYERGLDRQPSTESLVWLLLEEPYDSPELKNPWRAWFVGNLMEIVKRLPHSLQFHFGEILLRILMLREPDLEVSTDKFEKEIGYMSGSDDRRTVVVPSSSSNG
ncbi:hypothetical protein FQN57_000571 [Myotisia sp. PD_48]|nr:hypothetical protein FQN57_000571 [Myotisia sp. PD_48]